MKKAGRIKFFFGTLRGRLILSVAIVHAVLMTFFIFDLTSRQHKMILDHQQEEAVALSRALSTTASGWLAANDIAGLQELVDAQQQYPEIIFAILTDEHGRILAHSDKSKIGKFLTDMPGKAQLTLISKTFDLVDVAIPSILAGKLVGWVRIGLGQKASVKILNDITIKGVLYMLGAIIIGSFIAWLMGRRITRRLYAVQETINKVAAGNTTARSHIKGTDEAAILALEFNEMLDARDRMTNELRENERFLSETQAIARLGTYDWDLVNGNWKSSAILDQIFGIDKNYERTPDSWKNLIHPDWVDMIMDYVSTEVKSKHQKFDKEFKIIRADNGKECWVHGLGELKLDDHQQAIKLIGTISDITIHKEAEEKLIKANQRFDLAIDATSDGIWEWNIETNEEYFSPRWCQIIGYNYDDPALPHTFDSWSNRIHPDHSAYVMTALKAHLENGIPYDVEYLHLHKSGEYRWQKSTGKAVFNKSKKPKRMAGSIRDITERKQAEKKLQESNAELEQFAYVASHDLQEPLRMVSSFLTLLEEKYEPVIDETGKKYIFFAVDGAMRMKQIILDLLEFSRVGRTDGDRENIDLNALVNDLKLLFKKQIEEKNAIIQTDSLPVINSFKAPVRQVFQNLIGNALKYVKKDRAPEIHISVKDLKDHWQFAVADNGIGISTEYFHKIFVIFKRLHSREEYAGTGIGLAITKKIIENLGGKIWVESELGKSSIFYFTISKKQV